MRFFTTKYAMNTNCKENADQLSGKAIHEIYQEIQIQKPKEIKITAVIFERVFSPEKFRKNKIPGKVKNKHPRKGTTKYPCILFIHEI